MGIPKLPHNSFKSKLVGFTGTFLLGRPRPISRGNECLSRSRCGGRQKELLHGGMDHPHAHAAMKSLRVNPTRSRTAGTLVSAERVEAPARPSGRVAPPGRAGGRRQVLKQLPRYVSQPFPTPWPMLTTPPIDSQESLCRRPAFSIRREAHGTLHWHGELRLPPELAPTRCSCC